MTINIYPIVTTISSVKTYYLKWIFSTLQQTLLASIQFFSFKLLLFTMQPLKRLAMDIEEILAYRNRLRSTHFMKLPKQLVECMELFEQ